MKLKMCDEEALYKMKRIFEQLQNDCFLNPVWRLTIDLRVQHASRFRQRLYRCSAVRPVLQKLLQRI